MPSYQPPDVNAPVLSQFSLAGKICIVTGGARGIGVEIVRGLAEAGADVALLYSSSKNAHEVAAEIASKTGVRVEAFQADVTSRDSITQTINDITANFGKGRLDVIVANAGVTADIPALEYDEKTWSSNHRVNLDGAFWTAQAAGKIFKKQGKGNVIFTASVSASLVNVPQTQAAYNASKAAVVHLAKSLAVEWADFARVNCISPGFIETDMTSFRPKEMIDQWMTMVPARRMGHPAELKSAYVFLASDSCSYMTGADLIIDGGYVLP